MIYGSIETLTGGYLYDRRLLDHLVSRGDRAEVISLPSAEPLSLRPLRQRLAFVGPPAHSGALRCPFAG